MEDEDYEICATPICKTNVICRICGKETSMVTTNKCSSCFELETRLTNFMVSNDYNTLPWLEKQFNMYKRRREYAELMRKRNKEIYG